MLSELILAWKLYIQDVIRRNSKLKSDEQWERVDASFEGFMDFLVEQSKEGLKEENV